MNDPQCKKCPLSAMMHINNICVWGTGSPASSIMFIGEAPGFDENRSGVPFVGTAGKKFTEMLGEVGLKRSDVYITNVVKCQPPNNRVPEKEEITQCVSYLEEEIATINPLVIVPMGNVAMEYILGKKGITKFAGKDFYSDKYKCHVIPTFHPSYICRVPEHTQMGLIHFRKIKDFSQGKSIKSDVTYSVTRSIPDVDNLISILEHSTEFAFDIETTGFNFLKDKILCMSFSYKKNTAEVIPLYGHKLREIWSEDQRAYILSRFKTVMENPKISKIMQNGSFDIKFVKTLGINTENFSFDTMLAHHLLDENAKGFHDLGSLAMMYTDMGDYEAELRGIKESLTKEERAARRAELLRIKKSDLADDEKEDLLENLKSSPLKFSYADIPEDKLWEYSAADADATFRLKHILTDLLLKETAEKLSCFTVHSHKNLLRLLNVVVMPFRNVLTEMEYRGALLDKDYLGILNTSYSEKLSSLQFEFTLTPEVHQSISLLQEIENIKVGGRYDDQISRGKTPKLDREHYINKYAAEIKFNANSAAHLRVLLFSVLGLPPLKFSEKTKDASTDKETLAYYADKHSIVDLLVQNRHLEKFYSTYVVGMGKQTDDNNRIHTSYNSHVTVTGRLSSTYPALQVIPRDGDIKKAFISPLGWELTQFDLSQAEFRMWATLSGDKKMINDLINGLDIHRQTAADFWKIPIDQVTKAQRTAAKFVVFGLMYGRGAASVAEQVGISPHDATKIIDYFFGKYPVARAWLNSTRAFAKSKGFVVNPFGRIRRLPTAFSDRQEAVADAMRQAVNAPIQSAASDITGMSLVRIWKILKKENMQSFPVLTVHDSLVFENPPEERNKLITIGYNEITRGFTGINVPIETEVQNGVNWKEMIVINPKELKEWEAYKSGRRVETCST